MIQKNVKSRSLFDIIEAAQTCQNIQKVRPEALPRLRRHTSNARQFKDSHMEIVCLLQTSGCRIGQRQVGAP